MNKHRIICFFLSLFLGAPMLLAQRDTIPLNRQWSFRLSQEVHKDAVELVHLPHTWNAQDALSGDPFYKRGIGNYKKEIVVDSAWKGRRVYLRCGAANSIADLFVNGKHIGQHRGGYTAFVFELTDVLKYGEKNTILYRVDNSPNLEVMPLVGDFNMYGGLYRSVELILASPTSVSLLDDGASAFYIQTKRVEEQDADMQAEVVLSTSQIQEAKNLTLRLDILDPASKPVASVEKQIHSLAQSEGNIIQVPFSLSSVRLWNGKADPALYRASLRLYKGDTLLDQVQQHFGIRSSSTSAEEGFSLNGHPLRLNGVCRHQDRAELGNALHSAQQEEDARLIEEIGANAVRLSHYPHDPYFYRLMDEKGIIVWAEIPFVGPGGYADKGYVANAAFEANAKDQLREMIKQLYNHPSICFWGLFNEITQQGDDPLDLVKELNREAHLLDPYRLTTAASNQMGALNFVTDNIAWNRYDGWYGQSPEALAHFLDRMHLEHPSLKIGISEYGAGASIYQQQDTLSQPVPTSRWHPENWQTHYHIKNWEIIKNRPFLWGTFIWNLFDFGAAHRSEGDRLGINDKGLVTFDRTIKKDAFYFYKANWNPEPIIHIAEKRNESVGLRRTHLLVFSNLSELEIELNGQSLGTYRPNDIKLVQINDLVLKKGVNLVRVKGQTASGQWLEDSRRIVCR